MNFNNITILGLFASSQKSFIIPVYQRAYSWELDQWKALLNDLKEQIHSQNTYFFGNLLLETIEEDVSYEVIDGQQRLTTLTILVRALLTVLSEKDNANKELGTKIAEKEKLYFKVDGNKKLRPVSYDIAYYDSLIIDGHESFQPISRSQKKIKAGLQYFLLELRNEKFEDLLLILKKIESSKVTYIDLKGKKESALMFELQNNRGKDLTNMEKLKSYFMYQMYVHSLPEETNSNIEEISNIFKIIYGTINDIKFLDEDSVLLYHCNAFVKGYNYRTLEDIKDLFKKSNNKVVWIIDFVKELNSTFLNLKKLEESKDIYFVKLKKLKLPAFIYPFIIKGYKHFGEDDFKLNRLFKILEVLLFRYYLINSRADINSRLNSILLSFNGDVELLISTLKEKLNESWYWGDDRFSSILNEWMYENPVLNYLLWEYESSIQKKGYVVGNMELVREQIEHISPQVPPQGELLASGYEVDELNSYSNEFIKRELNCLGNLMLISGSHNASIGNKPFIHKLNSYNSNPLLNQQGEIKSFINITEESPIWDTFAIQRRQKVMLDFCIKRWDFSFC
jgi:uncharacterized protein with ParB-like and HNH nuclease domain